MSALKEGLTLVFIMIAIGCVLALFAAAAGAQGLHRPSGWQIHIYYAVPTNNRGWDTIGPPFPTKEFCEETAFPILIERIKDRVRCVYVDELYVRK